MWLEELQLSKLWMALVQVLVGEPISTVTEIQAEGRATTEFPRLARCQSQDALL